MFSDKTYEQQTIRRKNTTHEKGYRIEKIVKQIYET